MHSYLLADDTALRHFGARHVARRVTMVGRASRWRNINCTGQTVAVVKKKQFIKVNATGELRSVTKIHETGKCRAVRRRFSARTTEDGLALLKQPGTRWPDADGLYPLSDDLFISLPLTTHSSSCFRRLTSKEKRPGTRERGADRKGVKYRCHRLPP